MRWPLLLFTGALLLLLVPSTQALPDLEPNSMTISPQTPVKGEPFDGEVWVRNNGDVTAFNVNITVLNSSASCTPGENCDIVYQGTIEGIKGGENVSVSFDWRGETDSGSHVLTTRIDLDESIPETDEENNDLEFEYEVLESYMANLSFAAGPHLFIEPEVPAVGDPADVVVVFENGGHENTVATSFQVGFYSILQPDGTPELLEQVEVRSLYGGDMMQMNITWYPEVAGDYLLRVVLDDDGVVDESLEDDNVAEMEVMVRVHTPELTLDESRGLKIVPRDDWLEDAFQHHQVELVVYILNMDPVENATEVRVRFWDQPEGGSQLLIGDALLPLVQNATRFEGEVIPAVSTAAVVLWNDTALAGNHTIFVEIDPFDAIDEWDKDDNNFNFSVVVLEPLPDLVVLLVSVPGPAVYGIPGRVEVSVRNIGATATGQTAVELLINTDTVAHIWDISLEEGQQVLLAYDYTWAENWPRVKGWADASRDLDELDETNNIFEILVEVAAPHRDIAAETLEVPEHVFEGQRVKLLVTLQNIAATVPEFRVHLYLGEEQSPEASFNGYDLRYNESRRFPVWLNNTGSLVGDYNLTVQVVVLGSYKDENNSNDMVNGSVHFRLREYDLAVELGSLASTLPVNRTIEITVHVFNHGQANLEAGAMGAEVAVYVNGVELDLLPTGRLGMVTGEQKIIFYWTPTQVGSYVIEAVIDPYDVIDEPDESDNRAVQEVNVTVEAIPVVPTPSGRDSIISQPLVWVPLLVLAIVGAGMFAYYRLRGEDDYLPGYGADTRQAPSDGPARGTTTFRYDPDSGITYDAETGEVIGEQKKNQ